MSSGYVVMWENNVFVLYFTFRYILTCLTFQVVFLISIENEKTTQTKTNRSVARGEGH